MERGQAGLVRHYTDWFPQIENDFRCSSLNRLVLPLIKPGRILDLGCGSGALTAELLRGGHEVVSLDPSAEMVAMCREHLARRGVSSSGVYEGGVESAPFFGAFDTIVCLDVLEHIADDRAALRLMHQALRTHGRLVISVPALSFLYGPKDEAVGHFRRYSRSGLLALLRESGFAADRVRYWNALGVLPVWFSVKVRKKRLAEQFRYDRSFVSRAKNSALRWWFFGIENHVRWPLGLTLVVVARRRTP